MKKMIMGLAWLAMAFACKAQTLVQEGEQQVAALGVFIGAAEKGYGIMESGLSTIGGLKSGEFNLHSTFYASLESINPAIGNMGEVAEIVALQVATVEQVNASLARYRQNEALGSGEVTAVSQVLQVVLNAAISDVGMLMLVLTPGRLQMTDDQRMERIRELDAAARETYGQTVEITDQVDLLCLQRQAEAARIGTVQGLYGLP